MSRLGGASLYAEGGGVVGTAPGGMVAGSASASSSRRDWMASADAGNTVPQRWLAACAPSRSPASSAASPVFSNSAAPVTVPGGFHASPARATPADTRVLAQTYNTTAPQLNRLMRGSHSNKRTSLILLVTGEKGNGRPKAPAYATDYLAAAPERRKARVQRR